MHSLGKMRTDAEAAKAAEERLQKEDVGNGPHVIGHVERYEAGWIFYYQNTSGDELEGACPLFVPRNGSPPQFISYIRPKQESLLAFDSCGNANAKPLPEIQLISASDDAQRAAAAEVVREHSPVRLGLVKQKLNRCLNGHKEQLMTNSVDDARSLVLRLQEVGFSAKIMYGPAQGERSPPR